MDNFISKLSQKVNTQEAIKANFMADMAEKEQLKKQLEEYDAILQSIRNLYLKSEENAELIKELEKALVECKAPAEEQSALMHELKETLTKSDEFTHRECVKVYRNVQALLESQTEEVKKRLEELEKRIEESKAEDYSENIDSMLSKLDSIKGAVNTGIALAVLVLLVSAAHFVFDILIYLGITLF